MNCFKKNVTPRVKEIKFIPSSNYHNHIHNKKPYNERGVTNLGNIVFSLPKKSQ